MNKGEGLTLFSWRLRWQHITLDSYIPCLTDLCKALWEVMLSYHRTMQWHEEHVNMGASPGPGKRSSEGVPNCLWEASRAESHG